MTAFVLTSMGNVLSRTDNDHSESAALCYNESLRISRQRFGPHHEKVASALFNIASLYDSNSNFDKAMHYYNRALSVYKTNYSKELRVRLWQKAHRKSTKPIRRQFACDLCTIAQLVIKYILRPEAQMM